MEAHSLLISGPFKMCYTLNKWLEITSQVLHSYQNYSVTEHTNEIAKVLRNVGNVPLTLSFLAFLTVLYMLNVLQACCKIYLNNKVSDPGISCHHSCDSPLIPDDIINEIHHSASRLRNKEHEARCMQLLEMCPEAINTPKPPYMYTPFLKACSFGNSEAMKYMIQKGADIKAQTKDGETPLFLALWNLLKSDGCCDVSCLEILYRAGCDINAAKRHGYTPLHVAAKSGNIKAVKWLLEHGADPHSLTQCNLRPIDYAINEGHAEVAALLRAYS